MLGYGSKPLFSLLAHELVDIIVSIRRNFRDEVIHFKVIMISRSKMDEKVTGIVTKFDDRRLCAPEFKKKLIDIQSSGKFARSKVYRVSKN